MKTNRFLLPASLNGSWPGRLFGLWLALGLFCGSALAQKKIVVGYTMVPDFAAAFIAKERGFFEKRGLNVELQLITLTSAVPAAVLSDSIQIGGTTPPVLLQAVDSGLDLVALASGSTYDNTKGAIHIVARSGAGIATAQDLVGKKFGVPGLGGTLHVLVRRWLAEKGVDAKKVTFIEVPLPQIGDVLKGGSIDAAVTGEPFVARIVQTQVGAVVAGFSTDTPSGFATVVYTATSQWAAANAAQVKAFRDALTEAVAFANSHRDEAYAELGKYFKVPPPVLKATPWPNLGVELSEPSMRFWIATMQAQDMLRRQPDLTPLILR
jgi:NitT/TauT family transport system substrate-binding protein